MTDIQTLPFGEQVIRRDAFISKLLKRQRWRAAFLHFASEYRRQNDLPLQIAEAAKEWRLAALDYDKTLEEWNAEADPQMKDALWEQSQQYEMIRDGARAKVAMLADRDISAAI